MWDPETDLIRQATNPQSNIFCSGHSFLPDGTLLISGGHIPPNNTVGLNRAIIYDPYSDFWTDVPDMNGGRWYPSSTTLANGDVLVASGDITPTQPNELPEVFELDLADWKGLSSAGVYIPSYPRTFLAPDGRVFFATRQSRYLDTSGSGVWTDVAVKNVNSDDYGSAVMYEPGKILWTGGGNPPTETCEIIDLNAPVPSWQFTDSMALPRRQNNVTLLPDGKVLATGGSSAGGFSAESGAVLYAEMWDPNTGQWTIMASHGEFRGYHSTALLLPDGRVLSSGGDSSANAEVYSPPYLFNGLRPTITSAPASIGYGATFLVETVDATDIDEVIILRNGSVTHAQNWDQRACSLEFVIDSLNVDTTEAQLSVSGPGLATDCPPGPYMLFVLNSSGVPSVAEMLRLGGDAAPLANAGPDLTVTDADGTGSEQITLDGTGSSDPDGTIASYEWSEGGSPLATGATPTVALALGTHTITLTVTSSSGATSSDQVVISVVVNQPPIANAGPDQTLADTDGSGSEAVTLDGTGSTDDGTITLYEWSDNLGDPIADGSGPTPTLIVGVHTIALTVTDNDGLTDTATLTVTVEPPPPASFMHVGDLDGSGTLSGGNGPVRWKANVEVAVEDGDSDPVAGATVTGNFTPKGGNGKSCTTNASGRCIIQSRNIQERQATVVTFTVTGVTDGSRTYDPGANHDPDVSPPEDVSTGTSISVAAP